MRLYEKPGWGSAIVDVQLAFYGMPVELVTVGDLFHDDAARQSLAQVNPIVQVPTLVLSDGQVMTESAAITLLLADMAGTDALVPGPGAVERAQFLRWLVYLVATIYPGFYYGDVPERFVAKDAADEFVARVVEHRKSTWLVMEADAAGRGGPWFMGQRMTAIDVYLGCMVHWRPGEDWFRAETPNLWRAAEAIAALPTLTAVYKRNFG